MKLWKIGCAAMALLFIGGLQPSFASGLPPLNDKDKKQMASEVKQGADVSAQVAKENKFDTDKADVARVDKIGQRLAAIANTTQYHAAFGNDKVFPFTWHFSIIESKDVNAFSLPGGYVYINSGTLKFVHSDDELAGVLGHEITHSAHHHVQALSHEQSKMSTEMAIAMLAAALAHVKPEDMANLYQGAAYAQMGILNNKYSEAAEKDADHGGLFLMTKAGFNPVGMLTFMQRLEEQEKVSPTVELGILRDHPYTADRVIAVAEQLKEMNVDVTPQAVRQVTNAARVSVVPVSGGTVKLDFAGQTLATISDPTGDRAPNAAKTLNTLLDAGLQLYQVKADNANLVAADHTVLSFTAADAALTSGGNPQTLAANASAALRKGIWSEAIKGNSTSY